MATRELSDRMYDHFCAWQSSGLNQRSYCAQNGLRTAQFNYWVVKFRKQHRSVAVENPGFLPLVITSNRETPIFEISHSNGNRISFYQLIDFSLIKTLLE